MSASKELPRTSEQAFPALFTIDNSSRHESKDSTQERSLLSRLTPTVILINPNLDLHSLTSQIEHVIATSPNAGEFLGKYRSKDVTETVKEIVVKWASEGRDSRTFVRETLMTEENLEAVLRMMAVGVGKDVFDVKIKVNEKKKTDEEKKAAVEKKKVDDRKKANVIRQIEERKKVEEKEKLAEKKKQQPVQEEKKPLVKKPGDAARAAAEMVAAEKEVAERGKK
jgi:hypothetical protein